MPLIHCAPAPRRQNSLKINPEFGLALLTYLLAAFLPPTALTFFGLGYATAGGSPFEKIHPATYCVLAGLFALTVIGRGPVYLRLMSERKGLLFYLLSWAGLQVYTAVFQETPMSATIDTFLLPGLLFLLLATLSNKSSADMAKALDIIMAINSVLAIGELVLGFQLIPITAASANAGVIFLVNEWRPTAFMGHPLTGAAVTGAYFLILLSSQRIKSNWWKFSLLALNGVALLAYGGRMALATTFFCSVFYLAANGLKLLGGRRIRRSIAAALFLGPPVVVLGGALLLIPGFWIILFNG